MCVCECVWVGVGVCMCVCSACMCVCVCVCGNWKKGFQLCIVTLKNKLAHSHYIHSTHAHTVHKHTHTHTFKDTLGPPDLTINVVSFFKSGAV